MVFTLQRYIFRELFRIFVLATIGLTLILSFGLILRPVQEYGVGLRGVVHILLYFMPITLTFVLPMAALFASSLAYGRFASDNELNACRASGINLWTMVYPGLALALLVAITSLLLSFHVMPYFVKLAEKALKADAKQILFRNLQRRGYYELPTRESFRIYADYADSENDTLFGIVVAASGKGSNTKLYTAERAKVSFDSREGSNEMQLGVYNARMIGSSGGFSGNSEFLPIRQSFGSLLDDDIRFKKVNEMKQIYGNLMLFQPIADLVRPTYVQLVTDVLADDMSKKLRRAAKEGYELGGQTQRVRILAADYDLQEETINLVGPVVVEEYDAHSGQCLRRLRCEETASLHVGEEIPNLRLRLELPNARADPNGALEALHVVRDLVLPDAVRQRLGQYDPLQAVRSPVSSVILQGPPSSSLAAEQRELEKEIFVTLADIKAETNSRLVFGIGCIPMIMIGIALGIINRGGHLLSAFGASCAPAAVLIVAIISGRQVTANPGAQTLSGIAIMWSGLAFLVLLTVFMYRKLLRV